MKTKTCGSLAIVMTLLVLVQPHALAQSRASVAIQREAKKIADAFMADLVADRILAATNRYEWTHPKTLGRDALGSQSVRHTLNECGRPLDMRVENHGVPVVGEHVFTDGHTRPTFTFFYSSRTTRQGKRRKGHFRFQIDVEPGNDGRYYIAGFGCCCSRPSKAAAVT